MRGTEQNGSSVKKCGNGTGIKCGTAKLLMRTRGRSFGGKVRSTACEVEDEQVGGLLCFSYPLGSIGSRSAAEEPPEDGVFTLPPAKPKAEEMYTYKN